MAAKDLALGTVQFGLDYGATNTAGQVSEAEAVAILARAEAAGIDTLDTASAYGDSERVVGNCHAGGRFRIVTKTSPLKRVKIGDEELADISNRFQQSLTALRANSVAALLVHDTGDLLCAGGDRLWALMETWKAERRAAKIGISVYDVPELENVLARFPVEIVQLPLNAFDQRFAQPGLIAKLKANAIEVHARSAFLQGLLLAVPAEVPERLAKLRPAVARWREVCAAAGAAPAAAALAFTRSAGVDRTVIGVQSASQLDEIVAASSRTPVIDFRPFAATDPALADPRRWAAR